MEDTIEGHTNPGRSGSEMYFTKNKHYILKTMSNVEYKFFVQTFLMEYYEHFKAQEVERKEGSHEYANL